MISILVVLSELEHKRTLLDNKMMAAEKRTNFNVILPPFSVLG